MGEKYGIRDDCTRDDRVTICPNSTGLGYSTNRAKRGSWVRYEVDDHSSCGRVIGRVHCEGKTYLEVIATDTALTMAYVRWIMPAAVKECYSGPHLRVIQFLTGNWADPDTILQTAHDGFVRHDA